MATGNISIFDSAELAIGKAEVDFSADTFKLGFIKSAANGGHDPATSDALPHWNGAGTTNLYASQVVTTGTSYTGPKTLTGTTFTTISGAATFKANVVSIPTDASGFTNARWAILYDDTHSDKIAIGFVDLGADRSIVSIGFDIRWNNNGVNGTILTVGA